ncbi:MULTISPECIES: ribonuclease Z [Myroides]|uniref:Ribonuclease Z n=1 Tax=Myroides albus TaxID=2562892 RepID=A0A6I3LEG8_9FLAO|nr:MULTISPECIES: ribonuclease Z [Myroides]MTG97859.1 ribonuclease Z [Myroides albus]MVX35981.1 ribonuclease Z [Myroides sp. LoEW2-1]UVD79816.1 ribonuclease Z [Myroides albus]
MKLKEKGHTIIVSSNEVTIEEFVKKVEAQYSDSFKKANIIIDLSHNKDIVEEESLVLFEDLAISHMEEANKSFVIVVPDIDFNDFDGDLIVVRTLQEAHDLIEMDEIQRDLGF